MRQDHEERVRTQHGENAESSLSTMRLSDSLPFEVTMYALAIESSRTRTTQQMKEPMVANSLAECVRYPSDDRLLFDAKSGDHQAFTELCLRYRGVLRRRIYRIVRQREDAEDVLQETFLRAYQHLNSFRGECRFSTWMTRIGINASLMLLRKRRVLSEISAEDEDRAETPEVRDTRLNPEQSYLAEQTLLTVRKAMRRLPSNVRTLMDLYYVKELQLKDAAAILGITESNAKARLVRGRNRLRCSFAPGKLGAK